MDTIMQRRSIRKYTDEMVSSDDVEKILRAAMHAPSAANQQPWEFVVITDRKMLDEIPAIHPYAKMTETAPMGIVVCGDVSKEKVKGFWPQDCSAATQNILLAAQDLGLGAVWVGIYPAEERIVGFRRLLNLPENIVPFSLIPIGHPDETKTQVDRFDEERIHYNGWKSKKIPIA